MSLMIIFGILAFVGFFLIVLFMLPRSSAEGVLLDEVTRQARITQNVGTQTARSGVRIKGFEGGQMPLHRRLPKRGFTNIFKKQIAVVNISDLERFDNGATIDEAALRKAGLVKGHADGIKILGDGKLTKKLTVHANKFSEAARKHIEAAGGTCQETEE